MLGAVNHQDDYPAGSDAAWYAHHEQHEWDLTLTDGLNVRIFTHHPGQAGTEGNEHGYWTGDLGCGCGRFFCHKNVAMALYDIPEKEENRIHAYVPLTCFEERRDGRYLFLKRGQIFISLWFSSGFEDGADELLGKELCSFGRKHCIICQVGVKGETDSFEAFMNEIKAAPIMFDEKDMSVSYRDLYMCGGVRKIGGQTVSFPYDTYSCPFLYEKFNSGVVAVNGKVELDFNTVSD